MLPDSVPDPTLTPAESPLPSGATRSFACLPVPLTFTERSATVQPMERELVI
jgi:hypothetical protein